VPEAEGEVELPGSGGGDVDGYDAVDFVAEREVGCWGVLVCCDGCLL
jgi:hypothetical protein